MRRRSQRPTPPSLNVKTACSWRGIVPFTHLAREGRMTVTIGRRELLAALGGIAAAWPLAVWAQQPRRVGVLIPLYSQTDREGQASIVAFLDTFQKLGWSDGRNVRVEYRWGAGDAERAKAAAAALAHSAPDAIVVATTPALAELRRLTSTIPIVFIQIGDPVDSGFVAS